MRTANAINAPEPSEPVDNALESVLAFAGLAHRNDVACIKARIAIQPCDQGQPANDRHKRPGGVLGRVLE